MAKDRRIYIKVIGPAGNEQYVAVDPGTLAIDTITQLYVRSSDMEGAAVGQSIQYFPIPSTWKPQAPSITKLLATLEEILSTARGQLEGFENNNGLIDALGSKELWQKLLEHMNLGQIELATKVLTELLWEIAGVAVGAAAGFDHLTKKAAGHEAHATVVAQVLETEARHLEEHYLVWGAAADSLIQCLKKLEEQLLTAKQITGSVEIALKPRQKLAEQSRELLTTLKQFNRAAGEFLFGEGNTEAPDFTLINSMIAAIRELEVQTQTAWEDARGKFSGNSASVSSKLSALAAEFGGAQVRLQIFEQQHPSPQDVRPWQFSPDIITKTDYERAAAIVYTSWTDLAREVEQVLGNGRAFLSSRPSIPSELAAAIEAAENRYIPRLIALAEVDTTKPTNPPVEPGTTPPLSQSVSSDLPSVRTERYSEILELVAAVAYVLTCNKSIIAGSNTRNILQVLFLLDMVSTEEADRDQEIHAMLELSKQVTQVEDGGKPIEIWQTATTHYIAYRNSWEKGNRLKLKLAFAGKKFGAEMLKKHGLTEEQVRNSYKLFADASRPEYLNQKK